MSAIKFSPYIPNVEAWVEFYKNQPNEHKPFYTIGKPKQKGEEMQAIKLVTPTQSAIERAKSSLKREREIDDMVFTKPCKKKSLGANKKKPKKKKPKKKKQVASTIKGRTSKKE